MDTNPVAASTQFIVSAFGFGTQIIPLLNGVREFFGSKIKTSMLSYDERVLLETSKADFKCFLKDQPGCVLHVIDGLSNTYSSEAADILGGLVCESKLSFYIFDADDEPGFTMAEAWASNAREDGIEERKPRIGLTKQPKKNLTDARSGLKDAFDTVIFHGESISETDMTSTEKVVSLMASCVDGISNQTVTCMDFTDLHAVLKTGGYAYLEVGESDGNRVDLALQRAMENLNHWASDWTACKSALVFFHVNECIPIKAIDEACSQLLAVLNNNANIITACKPGPGDYRQARVTLLTLGINPFSVQG